MNTVSSLAAALSCVLLALPACSGTARRPDTDTILILHTNDMHSHFVPGDDDVGGMARIAGYVDRERSRRPDVLYLDAGDGVAGTPVSSRFEGRPVFTVMNTMGVDAFAVGNHEFDHGWARIEEYRRLAAFPLLSANVTGPDGRLIGDLAWKLFDVDGVRVGVIGVTTPNTPEITAGGMTAGCAFRPAAEAVAELLPEVEGRSDLVVVLSHLGYEGDVALAKAVHGIDVIVGGHSHTELPEPVLVGRTLIVQAGYYGKYVGRLELTVDLETGSVTTYDGQLITVTADFPKSGKTVAAITVWEERVAAEVDVVIGRAAKRWDKAALATRIEAIFGETLSTDLAFQNPGGIRAELAAGDILIRHVWTILPFENTLVTVRVKGEDLPEGLRRAAGEIDPHYVYTIATNSFVAAHADRYFPAGVESVEDSGIMMRDAVIEWIRERGGIE